MDSDEELISLITIGPDDTDVHSLDVQVELQNDIQDSHVSIPELPEGKDRHLFVSYSSEDADRVWPIVDAIEKRFSLKCVYADRDFQPGMDISQNIKESMQRCWKVLLMLSPNFTHSGWCKYEREFAFVTSMESGLNCIIPVLLEDCEVPPTLETVTYIDATKHACDVPHKVAQAVSKAELANYMLPFDNSKRYVNGYCINITAQRYPLCVCRPAKYTLKVKQSHLHAMRESKIKLSSIALHEAIQLLNSSSAVRYYDFTVSCWKICCWSIFLIPVLFLSILAVTAICKSTQPRFPGDLDDHSTLNYGIGLFAIICFVLYISTLCFIPFIPILCNRPKVPIQMMMTYYAAALCLDCDAVEEYLTGVIGSKQGIKENEQMQDKEFAFELIVEYLEGKTPLMNLDFDQLPDAPYNRHNVHKGKACICQCLEENLSVYVKKLKEKMRNKHTSVDLSILDD